MKPQNTFTGLRRRHYNGLWMVSELRRYIRGSVTTEEMAAYIRKEFFSHLETHLVEEEMVLFPDLPPDDDLRVRAEEQHIALHQLAESCTSVAQTSASIVEAFADLLEENIRFEERILFPYLQTLAGKKKAELN